MHTANSLYTHTITCPRTHRWVSWSVGKRCIVYIWYISVGSRRCIRAVLFFICKSSLLRERYWWGSSSHYANKHKNAQRCGHLYTKRLPNQAQLHARIKTHINALVNAKNYEHTRAFKIHRNISDKKKQREIETEHRERERTEREGRGRRITANITVHWQTYLR